MLSLIDVYYERERGGKQWASAKYLISCRDTGSTPHGVTHFPQDVGHHR